MHHRSQRGLALLCATAALAGGTLATVGAASASAAGPLDGLLDPVSVLLGQVTPLATVETVQVLIAGLSPDALGDVLVAANAGQLTKLLTAAAANGQLASALDTLTPTELATVVDGLTAQQTASLLASANPTQLSRLLTALTSTELAAALTNLNPTQLTTIVGGLTPTQISGLLPVGGSGSVISGLLGRANLLAGGTPSAPAVDTLVGQLNALLGAGMPAVQLTDLASLLTTSRSLLGTSGLNGAGLSTLLATANGLLATAPAQVAAPLQALAARLTELLTPPVTGGGQTGGGTPVGGTPSGGTTTGGETAPSPTPTGTTTTTPAAAGTTTRPATALARPATVTAAARPAVTASFTAYRATFSAIRVNAKRTRITFKLTCPATAPRGCAVTLNGRFAGQKAMRTMQLGLPPATTTPVTVTISRSTTRKLKKKGGSLTLSAKTAGSSLTTATGKLKIKRPRPGKAK